MKKLFVIVLSLAFVAFLSSFVIAEEWSADDIGKQVESDYLDLIDKHVEKLSEEYNVTAETETLLVRRAVKNYIIADLVDYTLLIFMAKYNVATGGIEMKKANAEIIGTLKELSASSNSQMLANINALRVMKGYPPLMKKSEMPMMPRSKK